VRSSPRSLLVSAESILSSPCFAERDLLDDVPSEVVGGERKVLITSNFKLQQPN
jgi:hypothetical protein